MTSINEISIKTLFDENYKPLFEKLHKCNMSNEDAQDIIHEAFLQVWRHRDTLPIEKAKGFLWICVMNDFKNSLKIKKGKTAWIEDCYDLPPIQPEVCQKDITPFLLRILPEKCRRVVELFFLDGWSNAEIADEMGITVQTVKNQKTRGIGLMRAAFR